MKDSELNSAGQVSKSCAMFSPCRTFRYLLRRTWDENTPPLVFIGLNPSTADETLDDPTIRRCLGFAKREGCGGLVMLNLFAFRSTDPKHMKTASDPVGPRNDAVLMNSCVGRTVVAAWGAHGTHRGRDIEVLRMLKDERVFCLGLTKENCPRHPLYIRADAALIEFKGMD